MLENMKCISRVDKDISHSFVSLTREIAGQWSDFTFPHINVLFYIFVTHILYKEIGTYIDKRCSC